MTEEERESIKNFIGVPKQPDGDISKRLELEKAFDKLRGKVEELGRDMIRGNMCKLCPHSQPRMAGGVEGGDVTECAVTEQVADPGNCPLEKGSEKEVKNGGSENTN